MSAQILTFPTAQRGIIARPGADRFHLIGDVRRVCICKGLNRVQQAVVVQCAEFWLDQRLSGDEVLKRAKAKAEQLLTPPGGDAA